MVWNHRVIATRKEPYGERSNEYQYAIHEVFYDNEGNITSWTEDAVGVVGDDMLEVKHSLNWMLEALNMPIIYADQVTFP